MKILNLYLAMLAVVVDALAVFFGMVLAYHIRTHGGTLFNWPFATYWHLALLVTPVWLILFGSQGLYNPRALPRGWNGLGRQLIGLIAGWGVVLIALYFWRSPQATTLSRLLVVYAIVFSSLVAVIGRLFIGTLLDLLYRTGAGSIRTVIIDGSRENPFVQQLENHWQNGHKVVSVLTADQAIEQLSALVKTQKIEEIIVDEPNLSDAKLFELLSWAEGQGINFAWVPSLLSVRTTNVETTTLAGTPIMYFLRTPLEGWRRIFKRLMDIVLSGLILIVLSPILLLLTMLIKLASPGPTIFRQERVGQDGRPFYIHKFRSMYADADERFKKFGGWSSDEKTDPRITPLGRILRKTNLDELPQFWDVFIGSMSLVGPRPEQAKYVEQFAKEVPDYRSRHHVKSGLTGWAQVNGLRGDTSIAERVKYDLYYIEHWSVLFDIRIVLATIILIIRSLIGTESKQSAE